MPETSKFEQPDLNHVPLPESSELLAQMQKIGEARGRKAGEIRLNDEGAQKAAPEVFSHIREINKLDSESGMHNEAGEPLPLKITDEAKKRDIVSKWILDPSDPDTMTRFLEDNLN